MGRLFRDALVAFLADDRYRAPNAVDHQEPLIVGHPRHGCADAAV